VFRPRLKRSIYQERHIVPGVVLCGEVHIRGKAEFDEFFPPSRPPQCWSDPSGSLESRERQFGFRRRAPGKRTGCADGAIWTLWSAVLTNADHGIR